MSEISSERPRILVVDDDPALAEMVQIVLSRQGYETRWCSDGAGVEAAVEEFDPALVLLDLMLPGRSGIEVCRDLRRHHGVPIIMLTARSDTQDVVRGLESGADDYVSKPFKTGELVARIRARLRPGPEPVAESTHLRLGDLTVDTRAHVVTRGSVEIPLTPLEFDLLATMAKRPNEVFSRDTLLEEVWGYRHAADTRLVNVHVQRLRSKIEPDPEHPSTIVTVRGVGYRACGGEEH